MIEITYTETTGWQSAIRGMRNPMRSWKNSDTAFWTYPSEGVAHKIGDNDLKLMKSLIASGNDHSKFMRYIVVTCDINAPRYWWLEIDQYKVGTVTNSESTMHTIHKRDFKLDDFSHEQLSKPSIDVLVGMIKVLNKCREAYTEIEDKDLKKTCWYQMIQLLPQSYNQTRTVQLNYAVLRNMYHARKNHKLNEWKDFCKWIESLPYSELITMSGGESK